MKHRTADDERRSAIVWLTAGVIFLIAMFGMWWLVEETNEQGTHDAELLPLFALIPLTIGAYHLVTGWPLAVKEGDALVAAAGRIGFPVGHASAQLGWRGLLSRPTWRILLYSSEEPPTRRGLVLVDAVDGQVLSHFSEENPEDWSAYDR